MTDAVTQRALRISTDGTAGPYILLPVSQLEEVHRLLGAHGVHYWVDENAISLDGSPEIATINFGRGADEASIQETLDSVR